MRRFLTILLLCAALPLAAQSGARNGEWRVFEARGRNKLHDPLVAGLLVNSRDITDQKRIEEHLRSSEERSRLILETAQDAFIG